eukprot:857158-Rhodomonas_salina.1
MTSINGSIARINGGGEATCVVHGGVALRVGDVRARDPRGLVLLLPTRNPSLSHRFLRFLRRGASSEAKTTPSLQYRPAMKSKQGRSRWAQVGSSRAVNLVCRLCTHMQQVEADGAEAARVALGFGPASCRCSCACRAALRETTPSAPDPGPPSSNDSIASRNHGSQRQHCIEKGQLRRREYQHSFDGRHQSQDWQE